MNRAKSLVHMSQVLLKAEDGLSLVFSVNRLQQTFMDRDDLFRHSEVRIKTAEKVGIDRHDGIQNELKDMIFGSLCEVLVKRNNEFENGGSVFQFLLCVQDIFIQGPEISLIGILDRLNENGLFDFT